MKLVKRITYMTIHEFNDPWPEEAPDLPTMFSALDGHVDCIQKNGFSLWVENNPADKIEVFVAAKRRYGTLDAVADDQPFVITNMQGAYS
jgi:hypothetical protein